MKYDFDKINNRYNTGCLKYDFAAERGKRADVLPLWIADMDFRVPEDVITAIKDRAEHGIFGYTDPKEDYFKTLCGWLERRHGWKAEQGGFTLVCGVVFAICSLIRALTKEGDGVIICQPVYYPFKSCVEDNDRKLIVSELKNDNGHYSVDFEDFERRIVENNVKMFILCNPHNPVGRVWTKEELERLGDICVKHGVFVVSDEIHADFVFGDNRHIPFCTVKKQFEDISAVCTAPTKTFNIAGLHVAHVYIRNAEAREKLRRELGRQGYDQPNIFGITACKAAYEHGEKWLEELKKYLADNISFTKEYLAKNLPQIGFCEPQGTYLLWLDMRKLGLSDEKLRDLVENEAKLWLDDGYIFGAGGSGFERINAACPRSVLKTALERLKNAIDNL